MHHTVTRFGPPVPFSSDLRATLSFGSPRTQLRVHAYAFFSANRLKGHTSMNWVVLDQVAWLNADNRSNLIYGRRQLYGPQALTRISWVQSGEPVSLTVNQQRDFHLGQSLGQLCSRRLPRNVHVILFLGFQHKPKRRPPPVCQRVTRHEAGLMTAYLRLEGICVI